MYDAPQAMDGHQSQGGAHLTYYSQNTSQDFFATANIQEAQAFSRDESFSAICPQSIQSSTVDIFSEQNLDLFLYDAFAFNSGEKDHSNCVAPRSNKCKHDEDSNLFLEEYQGNELSIQDEIIGLLMQVDDTPGADMTTVTEDEPQAVSPTPKRRKNCNIEQLCEDLLEFKMKYGHCNVPQKYPENPVLGRWCSNMRKGYNQIQKGKKPSVNLNMERINRLEEIGFKCKGMPYGITFDRRCEELEAFKAANGHCDVPTQYKENTSLGKWCSQMRSALRQLKKGNKIRYRISNERVARLEAIGFKWKDDANALTFDKRCQELIEFRKQFGHCNVPKRYAENNALRRWCGNLRAAYS